MDGMDSENERSEATLVLLVWFNVSYPDQSFYTFLISNSTGKTKWRLLCTCYVNIITSLNMVWDGLDIISSDGSVKRKAIPHHNSTLQLTHLKLCSPSPPNILTAENLCLLSKPGS